MDGDSHVEALVNICHIGSGESPKNCVARIRRVCLDTIENYLKYYRKFRRDKNNLTKQKITKQRRYILYKLEHIRDMHLILSTVEDLKINIDKYQLLNDKFNIYRKNIELIRKNILDYKKIGPKNEKKFKDEL